MVELERLTQLIDHYPGCDACDKAAAVEESSPEILKTLGISH